MSKKKKHKNSKTKSRGVELARDPFEAVLVVSENVDSKIDEQGYVHLQRRDEPKSAVAKFVSRNLNWRNSALVNLDEHGTAFWNLIDGERSLEEIEREFRREFDLKKKDSREATLKFTRDLMVRGLIQLKIEADDDLLSEMQGS